MTKQRRKHKLCLNCGHKLAIEHNYCSNCGQENTDNEASIGLLLREFTSNFFSLDSRFGRTFRPFLFNPGKITNSFNSGKRVHYANPIRWYLVISIFHFFFFSKVANSSESDGDNAAFRISDLGNVELTQHEFDSLYNLPDSLIDEGDWPLPDHYFRMVNHLKEEKLTAPQIMDTLQIASLDYSWFRRQIAKKVIKLNVDSEATVSQYFISQIPVIVFFLLPLYALLLKLFFYRKGLYIKHLIHSIHIHSFFFFLMGFVWIFAWVWWQDIYQDFRNNLAFGAVAITTLYILISFRKVYRTKWVWNIFKLFGIGFFYMLLVGTGLLIGVFLSLLFY